MKILYIITQSEFGGAQRNVFDLACALAKEHKIVVAAGSNGELLSRLQEKNIEIHHLKHLKRAINPYSDILAVFEIYSLIHTIQPDIVHLHSSKAGVVGAIASKCASTAKVIYTAHGFVFNEPGFFPKKEMFIWAEKISGWFKNQIICVSEKDRQSALTYHIASKYKLATIHNGLAEINFVSKEEAKNTLDITHLKSKKIIGTIAHFYPVKGLDYLINAAPEVIAKHPDTLFLIIGGGQEHSKLQALILKNKLTDNILLIDEIKNASQFVKAFDIFVLPSLKEGFPYAILEAMQAEVPIIASRVGGISEQIEDTISGLLVQPKNSHELAAKINLLIENKELADKLVKNAKARVKNEFSIQEMIEQTEKTYFHV